MPPMRSSGRRFLTGLLRFQLICAVGAISNVGAAAWLYDYQQNWWLAGLGGSSGGRAEGECPKTTTIASSFGGLSRRIANESMPAPLLRRSINRAASCAAGSPIAVRTSRSSTTSRRHRIR
jgi:hypothetical protein